MKRFLSIILVLGFLLTNIAAASEEEVTPISFESPKWNSLLKMMSDQYYTQYKEKYTFTAMDLFESVPGMIAGAIAVDIIPVIGGVGIQGAYVCRMKDSVAVLLMWETNGYLVEIPSEGNCRYLVLENCTESMLQTFAEEFGEDNMYEVDSDEFLQMIASIVSNVD